MQAGENPTPLRPTRAGFVRALPLTMPIEEVIERAREVGLELKPSDIHSARYYMRQQAAAAEAAPRPAFIPSIARNVEASTSNSENAPTKSAITRLIQERPADTSSRGVNGSASGRGHSRARSKVVTTEADVIQLRRLVLRLGTERTREIIQDLESLAFRLR